MSNTVTGTQDAATATKPQTGFTQSTGWQKRDSTWVISLFGTAVGAGILFLPINAGMGGFWPLVVMALLVGPMTYLAHRGLARFVLSSNKPNADITEVVEEHFGVGAGKLITLLYFFAIYPIVLIYGVGITNTVESFMVNQLQMSAPPRWILSIVLILGMMSVMLAGEKLMLKVTELLVYPLIAILAGISLYLIPDWTGAALAQVPSAKDFASTLWLTIPVLVFSFNHSPAISSFAVAQRRDYGDQAVQKSDAILKRTAGVLLCFVMFFVFSCVMSLTPAQLAEAKSQNIAVLSYLANQHASPIISYFGPLVAFVAIVSSFFGHYLGAREGLKGMIVQNMRKSGKEPNAKKVEMFIIAFFILTLWGTAIANPSILGMIESLGGPIIATILFIMPMYAIKRVPAMAKYQGHISNVFVAVMGMIAISAILFQLVG
ncbi:HAAAP family serine/threonine permease [Aeromonas sobria]|uniref:HAAAP family serine/threonine permease n=1 Tax=Aeromonas sobria TaxID=646 RepID=A0A1S2D786_AERSO|nr:MULTISPECIES: serine/threonine transporter [Aeromonas]ATL92413.1 HAAAP family serine/threonine permease [Aeromonas sp. CU5]MBS4685727.1 HAAAP family serine/threonine permease [Aeromonas sobria]MCX7128604.1 serine/threonine transporter [Aeromonas sp.]OHY96745.1 HAAAP family serine/threonine permease [Aeromonas sobria]TNH84740.1 HAAAP family serine/threonine permease [Aeromonas sobria]